MNEHQEQSAFIEWCDAKGQPYSSIYAVPNGGHRHIMTAVRLKKEGQRAGVPDLFLPLPNGKFHGLFIEMKTKTGRLTDKQLYWFDLLMLRGYKCVMCRGCDEAIKTITEYVG
jgi:hypothetical protein